MIDPTDSLSEQVVKQGKIIDALVRRASRQSDLGTSAYAAFQSAIALQAQVWSKSRDLERTSNELELVRFDRERSQKNLTDALSTMDGGFALFTDGRLEVCNDLFKTLVPDLTEHILPGLDVAEYFVLLEQSQYLTALDDRTRANLEQARGGPKGPSQSTFVLPLKGDRWFQISQQRTRSDNIILLQTDITGIVRKNRSEKDQLIDMQAHYLQAAFDYMSLGICTFTRDGTLMIHNERFRELLSLPFTLLQKGTSIGTILEFIRVNRLFPQTDLLDLKTWTHRLREQGNLRERVRHGNGRVLDLHVHPLPDRGFLVDIKDATLEFRATEVLEQRVEERTAELTQANQRLTRQSEEQARVEEELRIAKEQAEAAVSSKTRFLAAASHDLLQPVNAAKLFISTLLESSRGTEFETMVERLEGSFSSMEWLLHALLDISRLESTGTGLMPTDFCLGPMMRGLIQDYTPLAEKKGVQLGLVPSSQWVRSDQRYLMRSVQNLVVNAIQYTEKGRVLIGCRKRGSKVVLEVWDTGIGISHKDQTRIFEEFTRADNVPPGSGMGLGLSIVDRTCRHLGHKVWVRSKPGVGSVFSIEMNSVPPQPQIPLPERVIDTPFAACMDLIALVVENDPDVLFATVKRLEGWGVSVLGARSTAAALSMVADIGMAPDIILADYQLDGSDTGLAAMLAVRQETGVSVPAIMITADRSADLVLAGAKHNFTVLTKPVNPARLRPLIEWKARGTGPKPTEITDISMA